MLYSPTGGADVIKLRWAVSPPATSRRPNYVIRDGAGMRLVAAMAEPHPAGQGRHPIQGVASASRISPFAEVTAENDAQYFRRRAGEERRAAEVAAAPEARAAHEDLAKRYARLSERRVPAPGTQSAQAGIPKRAIGRFHDRAVVERQRRLDDLLDDALLGTFPASDPVSIVHVR